MSMKLAQLEVGRNWLAEHGVDSHLYPQSDSDGLASGALLARRAAAEVSFADPFSGPPDHTGSVVIIGQGVRPVQTRRPVLYVDHHPDPEPVEGTVVSDPDQVATSLLAWRLIGAPANDTWLAAIGVLANAGEDGLRRSGIYSGAIQPLRHLAILCSAAGRLRDGPQHAAFAMLKDAEGPEAALGAPQIARLEAARRQVLSLRQQAAQTSPRVGARAALVQIDVPAQVQAEIADAWAQRLSPLPVVVANRGWRLNRVSFAVRCGDERDLRVWLRKVFTPPQGFDDYARGSAAATGGSLTPAHFERFAAAILGSPAQRRTAARVIPPAHEGQLVARRGSRDDAHSASAAPRQLNRNRGVS